MVHGTQDLFVGVPWDRGKNAVIQVPTRCQGGVEFQCSEEMNSNAQSEEEIVKTELNKCH